MSDSGWDYCPALYYFKGALFEAIPVGEVTVLPSECSLTLTGAPIPWDECLPAHTAGKPAPTGILTVHEGRVGGIPMCADAP
jgi:hypothetical protein